jgi:hypothetical protein
MALSNVFREPRRELTETLIGILITSLFIGVDYLLALWVRHHHGLNKSDSVVTATLLLFILVLLIVASHWIGEWTCNRLRDAGLELRPRNRYR